MPCSPTTTHASTSWRLTFAREHSPTRPCSTPGSTPTTWSDAEQALTIARELDDPALLARALTACGSATVYDAEVAPRYFAEAIGLARALGDQWRLSQILGQQAQAALVTGDSIALRASAEEGREIADTIGDRFGSRQCGWRLASAHTVLQGDLTGAIALLRGVVAEAEAEHDGMSRVDRAHHAAAGAGIPG